MRLHSRMPTLSQIREETLPNLYELIAEHERMLREMEDADAAEKFSFDQTMRLWRQREIEEKF